MLKRITTLLLFQTLVGTVGASYMAAPMNGTGQKDLVAGLERLVTQGPSVVAEKLSGDYASSVRDHLHQLIGALGQGVDPGEEVDVAAIMDRARGLAGGLESSAHGDPASALPGNIANGELSATGKNGVAARGAGGREGWVGSESTVLMVDTGNGPEVRWRATPQAGVAPEEELRQVLVGAVQDSLRDSGRHRAHGHRGHSSEGQKITIVGEGKDVRITVKVE